MKNWFDTLEQREQIFVACGAAVVIVALLYAFIWMPLDRYQQRLGDSVAAWERSLAELQPLGNVPSVPAGSTGAPPDGVGQTPVVVVDQTLRARGLDRSLKRSQPTTGNGIRVEFENVAFDDLVLWLGDLNAQHAMDVTSGSFSVANRAEVGRINATLTLERAL